jgi:hypothetical protein
MLYVYRSKIMLIMSEKDFFCVQNCIHEEIKSRLNSGNACYHSVQSFVIPPAVQECKG